MGLVHLYCGDGKGKTTSAVGLALRAAGSGMKVSFVQFFKNGDSSEIKILSSISGITVKHTKDKFGFYFQMSEEEKSEANSAYSRLLSDSISKSDEYDMIILDEVISAYNYNCINKKDLIDFIARDIKPEIIMTGRNPDKTLSNLCDYVTEMKMIKHPYNNGVCARKGIEY